MLLDITRPGVVAPRRIDPAGVDGPTAGQARGPRWRRTGPGLFVPASTGHGVEQRIVEAVGSLPPGGAATGWAALCWLGAAWFDGEAPDGSPRPVPVAVGDHHAVRSRRGRQVSEDWLFAGDVVVVDGLPLTVPSRSATYEARVAADLVAAVRIIDMTLYDDLASLDELRTYTQRLIGRPGKVQLQKAIALADENAWSPMEVVMRQFWKRRHDRPLLCNAPVFDRTGRHLFTPDLLDVDAGVAGEYDGSIHDEASRRSRDLARAEMIRRLGIELVTMMGGRGEERRFLHRLDGAYDRAPAQDLASRPWTVEQPAWWVDTSTVARRRALSDADRARWLRHRRTGRSGREIA